MTTYTYTKINANRNAKHEISTFALGLGMTMAAFAGIWGTACIVSALVTVGPLNVLKGYFTAMIG